MRVFVDANVFISYLTLSPKSTEAKALLDYLIGKNYELVTSTNIVEEVFFILTKKLLKKLLEEEKSIYRDLLELRGAKDEDLIDKFYMIEEDIGWGEYYVSQKDENECVIRIENSPFAEALKGEVDYPVCSYFEGCFEALFSKIYGQKVVVEERLCRAKGDLFYVQIYYRNLLQ